MKHDDWKHSARPVLQKLRAFIDRKFPAEVVADRRGNIIWGENGVHYGDLVDEAAELFGENIALKLGDVKNFHGKPTMPSGISLCSYPGEKHPQVTIWTASERGRFQRYDDDALWIIDQAMRKRPRYSSVKGPIFASRVAFNMMRLLEEQGDLPKVRARLTPDMNAQTAEIEYRRDLKKGIHGKIKMRHNLIRAQFSTHYPFGKENGVYIDYFGNRLIIKKSKIPESMLPALIGRKLTDLVEMELFCGSEAVITSAIKCSEGYSFGIRENNPILFDDDSIEEQSETLLRKAA